MISSHGHGPVNLGDFYQALLFASIHNFLCSLNKDHLFVLVQSFRMNTDTPI